MMRLYGLGSNGNHQLSLGHEEDTSVPSVCILPDELTQSTKTGEWNIQCGGNHTVLHVDSKLYACGSNEHHQLGIDVGSLPLFTRIHAQRSWKMVACSFDFTVFVTDQEELFVAGRNDKGALGLGNQYQTETIQCIEFDMGTRHVIQIKASLNHVVMVLSDNSVYGWGSTRKLALGHGHASNSLGVPTLLELFPKTEKFRFLSVGKDWTCIATDTTIHFAGTHVRWPIERQNVHAEATVSMSSNWSSLHFLQDDGAVLSTGRRDRGQSSPDGLPPLKFLASGSEHSVGLGSDGKVYVWGWNEHGNCGLGKEDVTQVRTLPIPGEAVGCAGGFGTTLIWTLD